MRGHDARHVQADVPDIVSMAFEVGRERPVAASVVVERERATRVVADTQHCSNRSPWDSSEFQSPVAQSGPCSAKRPL
jgi:hypothetical protein